LYEKLDAGSRTETANALLVRYPAQALRLALLYALADGASAIGPEHLCAGAAVLAHCEEATRFVFGLDQYPDPITQRVADLLCEAQGEPVPRAALWKHLGRNVSAKQIDAALAALDAEGSVVVTRASAPLRNNTRPWFYAWKGRA
jgi:hypothetical protein